MSSLAQYNLSASDGTTSQAALGQEINIKGAVWKYVKASGALLSYGLAYITDAGLAIQATAALITTTKPTELVIPQFAFVDGEYGWAPVGPFFLREDDVTAFKVLSKIATKDLVMYGTTTAGSVDDATTNPPIQGLTLTANQTVDDTATACVALRRLTANC